MGMVRTLLNVSLVLTLAVTGFACSASDKPTATPVVVVVTATPPPAETPKAAEQKPTEAATKPTVAAAASPTAAPTGGQKVEVGALVVGRRPSGWMGGISRVRVGAEKNTGSSELRVGFYEEEVEGSGPMWRAAGWMAVIMSSLLLGVDPAEYRYTYDVNGAVDGPSAGAMMTVATMAALLGHSVNPDVVMTGTINPDGTIGPVGGIPQKIDGAAEKGKKVVLVPAGSRQSVDLNTNRSVDVVERGRGKNLQVKEVADIYEAYELVTGKPLPKAPGMKEVRPELPSTSFERVRAKAKEWYTRYWQLDSQFAALPSQVKVEGFTKLMSDAADYGAKADNYTRQGLPSAAYAQALNATLNASIGYNAAKVVEAWMNGGTKGAAMYMDSMQSVKLKNDAFLDRLQTQTPKTLGDIIAISDAYGYSNLAMGMMDLATAATQRKTKSEEETVAALAEAALYYAVAEHVIELGKDAIDVGTGYGKAPLPPKEKVDAVAELLRRAADANLNYFNSVVVDQLAQQYGVHPDVMKQRFLSKEMSYSFANSSLAALPRLKERAGNSPAGAYATLGSALNSYVNSSTLIAKYYSLGAEVDAEGDVTGVANERAMINMLDFAEKRAKEIIGLAVSLDAEPVQPVLYFETGKVDREGDVSGKLSALEGYWKASLEGQIIGMLSGKARLVK
ncbi:MAG: hypothetical protein M1370_01645 [Bacteroidetes bacterium]|nr:hypothetical protein [Bacteroidota bacterium]